MSNDFAKLLTPDPLHLQDLYFLGVSHKLRFLSITNSYLQGIHLDTTSQLKLDNKKIVRKLS